MAKCICNPQLGIECLWHYGTHAAEDRKTEARKRGRARAKKTVSQVRRSR